MRHEIVLAPQAVADYHALSARLRAIVRAGLETRLRHQPTATSRSRIKSLRGLAKPQYRLRLDDLRVFYDVVGRTVSILAIVPKAEAAVWLERCGVKS